MSAEARSSKTRRHGMPVYTETRTLPSLPRRASMISDAGPLSVPPLLAGAARVDVTPSGPVNICGFKERQSTGIHDRLYVRALVLDDGERRMAIVSWDKLNACSFERMREIRNRIHNETGIPPHAVLVNVTHTHSGSEGPFADATVEAVARAWESRRGARIGIGSRMIYGIGSNRRLPDGSGLWGSREPNPHAVMDNECGVIRVEDERRNPIAAVATYSSHASVVDENGSLLSGDYAGIAMQEIEKELGAKAVSLFLQGCAGDTGTHTFRRSRTIPEAERLGARFAGKVLGIFRRIDVTSSVRLEADAMMILLPQKKLDPGKPQTVPPITESDGIPVEIQALLIGESLIAVVGSMEAYAAIGLEVKSASHFARTFTLAYSNGPWIGYLPSAHRYSVADPDAVLTPFAPEAPGVLVGEVLTLMRKVGK